MSTIEMPRTSKGTPRGAGQPVAVPGSGRPAVADLADEALLRRIGQGDQEAFGAFYDRHASLVYSIARRIIADAHAQEECVQDVFLQIWRQADRFDDGRGTVGAWIAMTARARAIDYVRRAMRRDVPTDLVEPGARTPTSLRWLRVSTTPARWRARWPSSPASSTTPCA